MLFAKKYSISTPLFSRGFLIYGLLLLITSSIVCAQDTLPCTTNPFDPRPLPLCAPPEGGGSPPAPSSPLSGFLDSSGNVHTLYVTSSQHLEALISSNGAWTATDITQATGTPLAAPATPLLMRSQGAWDYIDINGDVHEIYFLSSGWSVPDITAQTGAPKAESGSALSGFLDNSGNVHMLYVTTSQHLEALISSSGAWTATDITQATGTPLAAARTPLLMRSQGAWDYIDINGDVHEIYFLSSGWSLPDITAQTGAPKAE